MRSVPTLLRLGWFTAALLFPALLAVTFRRSPGGADHERYLRDLEVARQSSAEVTSIARELTAGGQPLQDALTRAVLTLHQACSPLGAFPAYLDEAARGELDASFSSAKAAVRGEAKIVPEFQVQAALLQSRIEGLKGVAAELDGPAFASPEAQPAAARGRGLLGELLLWCLSPGEGLRARVEKDIAALDRGREQGPLNGALGFLVNDATLILKTRPEVDRLGAIFGEQGATRSLRDLTRTYHLLHERARRDDRERRLGLWLLLALLCGLGALELVVHLRVSSLALAEARRKLEAALGRLAQTHGEEQRVGWLRQRLLTLSSHALRTPLDLVDTAAGRLLEHGDGWPAERRRENILVVQGAALHMKQRLEAEGLLVRAEMGALDFHGEPGDLTAVCASACEKLAESGRRPAVALRASSDLGRAWFDPRLVELILNHLLDNALRYGRPGGDVTLGATRLDERARLTVTDDGIGIPPADLERVFETFHRGHNARATPGSGVGLTLVKRAVDAHGGEIRVESREGAGTTVTVELPITRGAFARTGG